MYVCTYVFMYICTYVCIYASMYVYMFIQLCLKVTSTNITRIHFHYTCTNHLFKCRHDNNCTSWALFTLLDILTSMKELTNIFGMDGILFQ